MVHVAHTKDADGHEFAHSHHLGWPHGHLATELQKCLLSPLPPWFKSHRDVPCSITVTAKCVGRIPLLEAGVPSADSVISEELCFPSLLPLCC